MMYGKSSLHLAVEIHKCDVSIQVSLLLQGISLLFISWCIIHTESTLLTYFITFNIENGQALNNLGSVYVDCGKLDAAADCYINALKIRHTRAHQGLARVHFLRNDKNAAYEEMTKLIEKARNNASAYEKRSEYCERELTKADLEMVTRLDPLRVYPYRYRAAGLISSNHSSSPPQSGEDKQIFKESPSETLRRHTQFSMY